MVWNKLFFLYNILVAGLSSWTSIDLADTTSKQIKYLNTIVLGLSIALVAFVLGIALGQTKHFCTTPALFEHFSVVTEIATWVIVMVIEGLLIAMVADPEFETLSTVSPRAQTLITSMLVVNSVGLAGGAIFRIQGALSK